MTVNGELIDERIKALKQEEESIEDQINELALHLTSGVTYTELKVMSSLERNKLMQKLNKKIEKASGQEWL